MSINVKWSDHLELLADELLKSWENDIKASGNLFDKICVVVNDMATRDWLKQHFLLEAKEKRVLINIDFVLLQEFINNWLEAQVHGTNPQDRHPSQHNYSTDILTWRIYNILSTCNDEALTPLKDYIGKDESKAAARCYALSARLAKLYDDYLTSRLPLLRHWETGEGNPPEYSIPEWQKFLYQRLYAEDNNSYASDYAQALSDESTASQALKHGMTNYRHVHIFDLPFMSEPIMLLLEKISQAIPMTAWTFNPCGDWLGDSNSKKEKRFQLWTAIKNGNIPAEIKFDSPEERLLGALASGVRATIQTQIDWGASEDSIVGTANSAFEKLAGLNTSIHACYSPRRELEIIKNGLHDFFKNHPDASPHDAIVLCADWATYAPVIEAVFGGNNQKPDSIPVTIASGIAGDSPLISSFKSLLEFRNNRFQVNAVLNLLSVASIAKKFNLDSDGIQKLREMIKSANIHWGLDDDDINSILNVDCAEKSYPFSWRRGLDRMALDMLYGTLPQDQKIIEAGDLGRIRPTGTVESEREKILIAINNFIDALAELRNYWSEAQERSAEEWENILLTIINHFYSIDDENIYDMQNIRRAITKTAAALQKAQALAGANNLIDGEVFTSAVIDRINAILPSTKSKSDAVLFAPLKTSSATPHRFVWICGLNDSSFPNIQHRASFDIIGQHPNLFDVDNRERDAFAFLKGLLSARDILALSYIGKNVKDNNDLPPSVLLNDFIDYLKEKSIAYQPHIHPLQSFSPQYFEKNSTLPPNYSKTNWKIATAINQTIAESQDQEPAENSPESAQNISAFEFNQNGPTVLELDDLIEFYSSPNKYLIKKRLKLKTAWHDNFDDNSPNETNIPDDIMTNLILNPSQSEDELQKIAENLVETGMAMETENAIKSMQEIIGKKYDGARQYPLNYQGDNKDYSCNGVTVYSAYAAYLNCRERTTHTLCFELSNHEIRLNFSHKSIPLKTAGAGEIQHVLYMNKGTSIYESTEIEAWLHHLAGHAAGLPFISVCCAQKPQGDAAKVLMPMATNEALEKLKPLIETAFSPLPPNYPDFNRVGGKNDTAYPPLDGKLDGEDGKLPFVSTNKRISKSAKSSK